MRPERLVMRAFGPYAAEEIIDFSALGAHPRFLIHGPTGAGKSTILDGICFALYGEASGDDRPPTMMRSDHADPEALTEVTLDFSIGAERYRVARVPEQERPKRRGEGTTVLRSTATMWRRTQAEGVEDEGSVVAHQWNKVTQAVEELLGFRADQFRQVVILPQGQFRRLLTARSADRQAIMETLFQTEIYRRIEEQLKGNSRKITRRLETLRDQRHIILESAGVSAGRDLEHLLIDARRDIVALEARRLDLDAAAAAARRALAEGRAIQEALRQRDEREADLLNLQQRRPVIEAHRIELSRARAAAAAHPAEEQAALTALRQAQAETQLDALSAAARRAEALCKEAEGGLERLRRAEPERLQRQGRLNELVQLRERVHELEEALGLLGELDARLGALDAERQDTAAHLDAQRLAAGALERARAQDAASAALAAELSEAVDRAAQGVEALDRLDAAAARLAEAGRALAEAEARFAEIEEECAQEILELSLIESAWFDAQAAILAARLVAGEPCPVCGAAEHPRPATREGSLPSEATLKRKRQKIEALRAARESARKQAEGHRLEEATELAACASLRERLGAALDRGALAAQLERDRALLDAARAAAARLAGLDAEISAVEAGIARSRADLELVEGQRAAAVERRAAAHAVVLDRERHVPASLRSPEALDAAIEAAAAEIEAMTLALDEARRCARDAQERFAQAQTERDAAQGALNQASASAADARALFAARLAAEGFEGEPAWRDALRPEAERARLDGLIHAYDGQLEAASREAARARQIADNLSPPDLDALQIADEAARALHEDALKAETTQRERVEQMRDRHVMLRALDDEREVLEARFAVVGRLSQVATGRNELRMTFQRFVLTTLLDEVLECASRRLRVMSGRRYDLRRASGPDDARAAGGLELEVLDSYTGTQRNVITLSGGESFLAALSLALGLADVVQSYAGGIHVEAIFIDEGFGSLDAEAMDLALQALDDLRLGGRLVGIISHVPEIKERIPARLEVIRDLKGSRAIFRVP